MRKYLITEEQLSRVLLEEEKPITKGIALHVSDDQGEYYESKLMDFRSEEEYNEWKENLEEGTEIIGEMDIEKNEPQPMNESTDLKKKGLDILKRMVKKEYPYILDIIPKEFKSGYATYLPCDIKIDLNKFYKITNTTPPKKYLEDRHMLELLEERGMYLRRYLDEEYKEDYSIEFNDNITKLMNNVYGMLPKDMQITKFQDRRDDELGMLNDPEFYLRWRDDKETIELEIDYFIPQVNVENL